MISQQGNKSVQIIGYGPEKANQTAVDAIASDACALGAEPSNTDNTTFIQQALDKGGKVIVSKPGVYLTKGLKIGDNTVFELYQGVTLKLIPNTKEYILRNKVSLDGTANRNKNIKVIGTFDQNGQNGNGSAGSIQSGQYNGHSLLFHKVDGLDYVNVKVLNSIKYAIFTIDAVNVNATDINFATLSDGMHFQPPIRNLNIKNVTGYTHDDMVAFTLGDYTEHKVSNIGDFENVKIDGVNAEDSLCILKVTGSGQGGLYSFKNFEVSNLSGTTTSSCIKITDDTTDGNTDLVNTKVWGFKFKNIYCKSKQSHDIIIAPIDGEITIEGINFDCYLDTVSRIRIPDNRKLTRLTIKDVFIPETFLGQSFINVSSGASIDYLIFQGINGKNLYKNFLVNYGTIKSIQMNNVTVDAKTKTGALAYFAAKISTPIDFIISNFTITNLGYLVMTKTALNIFLNNGTQTGINNRIFIMQELTATDSDVRLNLNNADGNYTPTWQNASTGGKFSANMNSGVIDNDLPTITPKIYDRVICTNANNRGVFVRNNTSWVLTVPYS